MEGGKEEERWGGEGTEGGVGEEGLGPFSPFIIKRLKKSFLFLLKIIV